METPLDLLFRDGRSTAPYSADASAWASGQSADQEMTMDQDTSSDKAPTKICPNEACKFDNSHEDANFCILCGTLLYRQCDNCLDVNPRYARFCYYCGTNLEDLREEALSDEELFEPEHSEPGLDQEYAEHATSQPPENAAEPDDNWPGTL